MLRTTTATSGDDDDGSDETRMALPLERPLEGGDVPEEVTELDGFAYLQSVVNERKTLPNIAVAPQKEQSIGGSLKKKAEEVAASVPSFDFDDELAKILQEEAILSKTPLSLNLAPDPDWEDAFVTQFLGLRRANAQKRLLWEDECAKTAPALPKLPPLDNGQAWRAFCMGRSDGATVAVVPTPPFCSIVFQLGHANSMTVVRHIIEWFKREEGGESDESEDDEDGVGERKEKEEVEGGLRAEGPAGQWLFALLTQVDSLLNREAAADLRELLKVFLKRRLAWNEVKDGTRELSALNTLITILGHVFGQKDLLPLPLSLSSPS